MVIVPEEIIPDMVSGSRKGSSIFFGLKNTILYHHPLPKN